MTLIQKCLKNLSNLWLAVRFIIQMMKNQQINSGGGLIMMTKRQNNKLPKKKCFGGYGEMIMPTIKKLKLSLFNVIC